MRKIFTSSFVLGLVLAGCSNRLPVTGGVRQPTRNPVVKKAAEPVEVTIVGLNDLHGAIEAKKLALKVAGGEVAVGVGGIEHMAGYFDAVRAHNPGGTLFVDSGDIYQGSLLSNWFQGKSVVKAYNALQVDASTFGNHEFDFGDRKGKAAGEAVDPQGALKALLAEAQFKVVSTNVSRKTDVPQFPGTIPSAIFVRNGVRIGVLGVTTVTTPNQSSPRNLVGLQFNALQSTVASEAARLRSDGAQVVILLSHAGGSCNMKLPPEKGDEACKSNPTDEMTELLEKLPKGTVDVVMAGHTHLAQAHFIRGVPVLQTTGYGSSFSFVRLWVNPDSLATAPQAQRISKIELRKPVYFCHTHYANYDSCNPDDATPADLGKPVAPTFLGKTIQPRGDLRTVLAPYEKEVEALQKKPLFDLPKKLTHDRTVESPTANCIADIWYRAAFEGNIPPNSAFIGHSGGIRFGLPAGKVTYGDLYKVLPFDESAVIVKMKGDLVEKYVDALSMTKKSIAVLSAGLQISLKKAEVFPRYVGLTMADGKSPDKNTEYLVVMSEFNTLEGGSLDAIFSGPRKENGIRLVGDSLRDFLALSFAKGMPNEKLPDSCLNAGPLDRTKFVD